MTQPPYPGGQYPGGPYQGDPYQSGPYPGGPYPGGYPPAPPQPYAGYSSPAPASPKNGLGIAALVVAILGLVSCWSIFGGIILGLVAVILGFVGRGRVKRGQATNGGVATTGIVLGALSIVLGLVFIPIWYSFFQGAGVTDYVDCLSKAGSDQQAAQRCADQFQRRVEDKFSVTLTPTSTP